MELERIDLCLVARRLSCFSTIPRRGYSHALLTVFAYCKKHNMPKVVFDHWKKDWSKTDWVSHNWKPFYPDINVRGEVHPP